MTPPREPDIDLHSLLDEAGEWCQARHPGWETLHARLAKARPAFNETVAEPRSSLRPWRRARGWASVACAAAVLVAVGAYVFLPISPPAPETTIVQAPTTPEPPVFRIGLADDCRIEPVGDTLYEVVEPRRIRLEHGELYVSVGAESLPQDPFVVETPAGEARSMASSFVVETRSVDATAKPPKARGDAAMSPHFSSMRALTHVMVLAGVVQLVGAELNLEGRSGAVLAAETNPPAKPPQRLTVPGFWMLAAPQTTEEVGLTDDQRAKLQEISNAYHEGIRSVRVNFQEIPVEQRQQTITRIQQKSRDAARNAYEQARNVLTPEQIDQLKSIQLRTSGWSFLQTDRYHQQLGITPKQKEKLAAVVADMQSRFVAVQEEMRKAREESFEKALEILDPEQIEKLKELGIGQHFWWQPEADDQAERE